MKGLWDYKTDSLYVPSGHCRVQSTEETYEVGSSSKLRNVQKCITNKRSDNVLSVVLANEITKLPYKRNCLIQFNFINFHLRTNFNHIRFQIYHKTPTNQVHIFYCDALDRRSWALSFAVPKHFLFTQFQLQLRAAFGVHNTDLHGSALICRTLICSTLIEEISPFSVEWKACC